MSGRITRSSAVSVCWRTKSQCSTMPASSTTRCSCSSPQAPRTCGLRRAVVRALVSRRSCSPVCCTVCTWLRRSAAIATRSFSTSVNRSWKRCSESLTGPSSASVALSRASAWAFGGQALPVDRLAGHHLELGQHLLPVRRQRPGVLHRRVPLGLRPRHRRRHLGRLGLRGRRQRSGLGHVRAGLSGLGADLGGLGTSLGGLGPGLGHVGLLPRAVGVSPGRLRLLTGSGDQHGDGVPAGRAEDHAGDQRDRGGDVHARDPARCHRQSFGPRSGASSGRSDSVAPSAADHRDQNAPTTSDQEEHEAAGQGEPLRRGEDGASSARTGVRAG